LPRSRLSRRERYTASATEVYVGAFAGASR